MLTAFICQYFIPEQAYFCYKYGLLCLYLYHDKQHHFHFHTLLDKFFVSEFLCLLALQIGVLAKILPILLNHFPISSSLYSEKIYKYSPAITSNKLIEM